MFTTFFRIFTIIYSWFLDPLDLTRARFLNLQDFTRLKIVFGLGSKIS
jgi:hypothetical protein